MATTSSPVEVLLSVAARNVLSNARLHTPFASSVTHDCAVSADNIAAAASAGRAFAGPSSLPSTAHHRAPAHHWTPGELEVSKSGGVHAARRRRQARVRVWRARTAVQHCSPLVAPCPQTLMTIVESADPTMRLPVHRGLEALGMHEWEEGSANAVLVVLARMHRVRRKGCGRQVPPSSSVRQLELQALCGSAATGSHQHNPQLPLDTGSAASAAFPAKAAFAACPQTNMHHSDVKRRNAQRYGFPPLQAGPPCPTPTAQCTHVSSPSCGC